MTTPFQTRLKRILETVFSVSSLLVVCGLLIALFILCALDVVLWVMPSLPALISVIVSGATLLVGSLFLLSSRKIASRTLLADIPKLYVPINATDLHKPVYEMIQTELARSAALRSRARPLPEDVPEHSGWGQPGTAFEGVHFRTAAKRTFENLETEVAQTWPDLARDRRMTGRGYMRFLVEKKIVSEDVAGFYMQRYEAARFGKQELCADEFRDLAKLHAALLREISGQQ